MILGDLFEPVFGETAHRLDPAPLSPGSICDPNDKHDGLFLDAHAMFDLLLRKDGLAYATAVYESLYGLVIPTVELLDAIATWGPVIDVGAGTGYLTHLLRRRGVDVTAIDIAPTGTRIRNTTFSDISPRWADIEIGNASRLPANESATLLLSWPMPEPSPMASAALRSSQATRLVYMGDDLCCGDDAFHVELQAWQLERHVALPVTGRGHHPARFYRRR